MNTTHYSVLPPPPRTHEYKYTGLCSEQLAAVPIQTRSRLMADRLMIAAKTKKTEAWGAKDDGNNDGDDEVQLIIKVARSC